MELIHEPKHHIDVTKRVKWLEVNNDMCHNYYYLVYVRIYNANKTRYRKAKFVVFFDAQDVAEWANPYGDCCTYSQEDIDDLLDNEIMNTCDLIKSYDDTAEFYNYCRQTINRFNSVYAA